MTDMEDWWLSKLHFIRLPQDTVYWLYSSYHGYLQFKYDILKYFNVYYDEATRLQLELENKVISIDNTPTNGFEFVPLITQSGERSSSFAIKDPRIENSRSAVYLSGLQTYTFNIDTIINRKCQYATDKIGNLFLIPCNDNRFDYLKCTDNQFTNGGNDGATVSTK